MTAAAESTDAATDRAGSPEVGRSLVVGDVATNYHDVGSGPVVLLLHGSGPGVSAWANWRGVIPGLSEDFRVLAPDVLGFGYTPGPSSGRYTLDLWAEHVLGFLDALGVGRLHVVGNSFGGALALKLATLRPDLVDRLVLMGSVGVASVLSPGLDQVWGFTPSRENMRAMLDLFAWDRARVTDDLADVRLAAATRPGVQEAFAAMFPSPRQSALDALVVDERQVGALQQPTLVLHGREDQVIPLSNSLRLLELVPRAQLHVFGQCGHWVQIEQQARFLRLVREFLQEGAASDA